MRHCARSSGRASLTGLKPNREIFRGKRYLPIGLVEAGRGCHFKCEFCAVQSMFGATQTRRPLDEVVAEMASIRDKNTLFFFVDDNITSNLGEAKQFFRALAPLGVRWVSQSSINAAHDEEFLELLDIEHRLGDGVLRPGFDLVLEAANLLVQIGCSGICSDADHKRRCVAHRVRSHIKALIQAVSSEV